MRKFAARFTVSGEEFMKLKPKGANIREVAFTT
jgi:hypothetical protein